MLASVDPDLDNGPRTDKSATMRMCAVSREVRPIDELIRFVVAPSGEVIADLKRKLPGRGLWVMASRRAVAEAQPQSAATIRKANSASEGMVWMTPTMPRIAWEARGSLAAAMPSGMPAAMLAASETSTSTRCSRVRRQKSGPKSVPRKLRFAPLASPKKSAAACAKLCPSSSAAAFMRII